MLVINVSTRRKRECCWGILTLLVIILQLPLGHNAAYSQYRPAMPPPPMPGDQELIARTITGLNQALRLRDKNRMRAFFESPVTIVSAPITPNQAECDTTLKLSTLCIKGKTAIATCLVQDCRQETVDSINMSLAKNGISWQLVQTPEFLQFLGQLAGGLISPDSIDLKRTTAKPTGDTHFQTLTVASIQVDDAMLISNPHPWTGTYVINAGLTSSNISRRLFADNTRLSIGAVYIDGNPDNAVGFHLDPVWNRIVFAQKSGNWINSFGDWDADGWYFVNPTGMSVDVRDTIYIADSDHKKIVKLYYNSGTASLISYFSVPGVLHPVDIAIDQVGTLQSPPVPQTDNVWIVDDVGGKLVAIHRDGSVQLSVTQYSVVINGHTYYYPLTGVSKVQTLESGRIAFIDRARMAFVVAYRPTSGTAIALNSTEFNPATSDLSCIGMDYNSEWWVGDLSQKMYHHFTVDGQYVASYDAANTPVGQFSSPVTASKSPYLPSGNQLYQSQYFYTSDLWGTSTGMRSFFPGTDALNLALSNQYYFCNLCFTFLLTNESHVEASIWDHSVDPNHLGSPIKRYDYGFLNAGNCSVSIGKFWLYSGTFDFQLELYPSHWWSYGLSSLTNGWTYKSMTFSNGPPSTWGASITPVPSNQTCFQYGTAGTWMVSPACPDGNYIYQWYICNGACPYNQWTSVGGNSPTLSMTVPNPQYFLLKCHVTNNVTGGSSYDAYYTNCPPPPPPPSCPFVYTWDGAHFQEDNNLLPRSEEPTQIGIDVTDYYLLQKPLKSQNGKYALQIREFEHERSHLDQFRLFAVDHPSNINIALSDSGDIIPFVSPHRLRLARLRGADITRSLLYRDSLQTRLNKTDTLSLSFGDTSYSSSNEMRDKQEFAHPQSLTSGGNGIIVNVSKPPPKQQDKVTILAHIRTPLGITGSFGFRLKPSLFFIPLGTDSTTNIQIVFDEGAILDYINYAVRVHQNYQKNEIPLRYAVHSTVGDVTSQLASIDNSYALLEPGQSIDLQFDAPSPPLGGFSRDFILMTRGRYETITDSGGAQNKALTQTSPTASSFQFDPSYPNPFNPTTTMDYQLAAPGYVSIVVYNLLGQETARLVQSRQDAGCYSTSWNAESSPSGIYYVRMLVSDSYGKQLYVSTKKLLLMK